VIRTAALGRLRGGKVHEWRWNGKKNSGRKVNPGQFSVRVTAVRGVAVERDMPRTVEVAALPVHIIHRSVQPQKFSPLVQDGVADTTRFRFATDVAAIDTIRLVNHRDKPVRTIHLGKLSGHHHHGWTWNGRNQRGHLVSPGTYRIKVTAVHYNHTTTSAWQRITVKRKPPSGGGGGGGGGGGCTPGYSPCLIDHNGADYDCAGGTGNGPYYTEPGVVYSVTGSDPYGLDGDNDGRGCEW
jgi:hypothetical protein